MGSPSAPVGPLWAPFGTFLCALKATEVLVKWVFPFYQDQQCAFWPVRGPLGCHLGPLCIPRGHPLVLIWSLGSHLVALEISICKQKVLHGLLGPSRGPLGTLLWALLSKGAERERKGSHSSRKKNMVIFVSRTCMLIYVHQLRIDYCDIKVFSL